MSTSVFAQTRYPRFSPSRHCTWSAESIAARLEDKIVTGMQTGAGKAEAAPLGEARRQRKGAARCHFGSAQT